MEQPEKILDKGTPVRTHAVLETASGMIAPLGNILARRPGALGEIVMALPGHGGDVYLVKHEDTEAVYCYTEFEADDGRDPTLLKPGRRVQVMITGRTGKYIAEVLEARKYGHRNVRVTQVVKGSDAMVGAVLKCEDYIPQGYVSVGGGNG